MGTPVFMTRLRYALAAVLIFATWTFTEIKLFASPLPLEGIRLAFACGLWPVGWLAAFLMTKATE